MPKKLILKNKLQRQIDSARKEIHTDQYSISIGELANLYRDGELDIHPEFQRFYRWDEYKKSRFIESILLGIPIPSIFVSQRADGKWDVIDGLQRLSTIFQLMGTLIDQKGQKVDPLVLTKTKYLPALENRSWSGFSDSLSLNSAQQLLIKRAKLDIKIILRESDDSAKFELFERLNTGGAELSPQEIRNAKLVAVNPAMHDWLVKGLAEYDDFKSCILLSDRQSQERYDVELCLRFLVLRTLSPEELSTVRDLNTFLTAGMDVLLKTFDKIRAAEEAAFKATFSILKEATLDDSFRRYDSQRKRFSGPFLISAFEAIALGIGFHMPESKLAFAGPDLLEKIKLLWSKKEFVESSGMGVRGSTRVPKTVPFGRTYFSP